MKAAGYIITALGTIAWLLGGCLCSNELWIVPPLLFGGGTLMIGFGLWLVQKKEQLDRRNKRKRRMERHINDMDKLRASQEIKSEYQKLQIKEILK